MMLGMNIMPFEDTLLQTNLWIISVDKIECYSRLKTDDTHNYHSIINGYFMFAWRFLVIHLSWSKFIPTFICSPFIILKPSEFNFTLYFNLFWYNRLYFWTTTGLCNPFLSNGLVNTHLPNNRKAVFSAWSVRSGYKKTKIVWVSWVSRRQPARIWAWKRRSWVEGISWASSHDREGKTQCVI
jgi:hypothetical protein